LLISSHRQLWLDAISHATGDLRWWQ